jgi:receptor expression-enhancing protein 5/6
MWLTYWTVYGIFVVLDEFSGTITAFIPFYYFAKVCFLIWLYNPATQGAMAIYHSFFKPMMKKYEKQINEGIKVLKDLTNNVDKLQSSNLNGHTPKGDGETITRKSDDMISKSGDFQTSNGAFFRSNH